MKSNPVMRMKIDNRYKDDHIVKKNGVLIGNKKTMLIEPVNTPAQMLQPALRIGPALAKAMKKEGIL